MDAFAKIVTYIFEDLPPRHRRERPTLEEKVVVHADASPQVTIVDASQAIVNMTYDPLGCITTLTYDAALFLPKKQKG